MGSKDTIIHRALNLYYNTLRLPSLIILLLETPHFRHDRWFIPLLLGLLRIRRNQEVGLPQSSPSLPQLQLRARIVIRQRLGNDH